MNTAWINRARPFAALALGLALVGCDVAVDQGSASAPAVVEQTQRATTAPRVSRQASPAPSQSSPAPTQTSTRENVALAQRPTAAPADASALSEYESIINSVYERNVNGVVSLTDGQVSGSGYLIDDQGHIVTNNHVIESMQQIFVSFANGSSTSGELVGTFPEGDIAVVRVAEVPQGVQPVTLGDSSSLRVGQITIAIGSPLRLQQTVTSGIVSALNRSIEDLGEADPNSSLQGLIQTDASINPGNSGGPLFDSRGNVIGMNTLIASLNQGSVGLGFAVPVNRIKHVVPQLIQNGRYQRPTLGITIVSLSSAAAARIVEQVGLPTRGVMIESVVQGGPAEAAGLRGATEGVNLSDGSTFPTNGDIITGVNGKPVETTGDLRNILETEADPGDTITVTFLRDGREQQTQLQLGGSQ